MQQAVRLQAEREKEMRRVVAQKITEKQGYGPIRTTEEAVS